MERCRAIFDLSKMADLWVDPQRTESVEEQQPTSVGLSEAGVESMHNSIYLYTRQCRRSMLALVFNLLSGQSIPAWPHHFPMGVRGPWMQGAAALIKCSYGNRAES